MDGNPNMADLFGKMADMQQRVADAQAKLAEERVTAEAGGGMVAVTADGTGRIVSIKIEPAAVDPSDLELLEVGHRLLHARATPRARGCAGPALT